MLRRLLPLGLLITAVLSAQPAAAVEVATGWIHADVGLDQEGNGFWAGIGLRTPLGAGPFDFTATAEYQLKRGTQPMIVSNPDLGAVRSDAEVTLHVVQPAGFLGWNILRGALVPRLYAGLSVAVKVGETWDRTPGSTGVDYSYEDLDFLVHGGAMLRYRERVFLDLRFSQGLLEQLVVRDGSAAGKADDPLTGARLPEPGDTISSFQLGIGVAFH